MFVGFEQNKLILTQLLLKGELLEWLLKKVSKFVYQRPQSFCQQFCFSHGASAWPGDWNQTKFQMEQKISRNSKFWDGQSWIWLTHFYLMKTGSRRMEKGRLCSPLSVQLWVAQCSVVPVHVAWTGLSKCIDIAVLVITEQEVQYFN